MQSDEEHTPPAARTGNRRGGCVRRPACLDHDVESDSIAQLEQELGEVVPRRIRDLLGSERGGSCQPLVVDVDRDDAAVLRTARCAGDDERADAAHSDHGDKVVRTLPDSGEGVQGHGERLRHGSRVVVACVGHGATDVGGRRHILREPAVDLKPERPVLGAEVRPVAEAPAAASARDSRTGNDPLAPLERGDVLAEVDHPPHELVPENHPGSTENRTVIPFRSVRAADSRAGHLEDDFACGRRRVGDGLDPDIARAVEDSRSHPLNTRSGP